MKLLFLMEQHKTPTGIIVNRNCLVPPESIRLGHSRDNDGFAVFRSFEVGFCSKQMKKKRDVA